MHPLDRPPSKLLPYGQVLHHLRETFQLLLELLEGDGAAVVLVGRFEKCQCQVIQLLLWQGDGALPQAGLQDRVQLIWVDGAATYEEGELAPSPNRSNNVLILCY